MIFNSEMIHSNIFIPRNDWMVKAFMCRKSIQVERFENLVAKEVQAETGVNPLNYRHYRGGKVVQARQLFLVMMTKYTNRTYESIAGIVNRDHSTINHCIKAVQNQCDTDKRYREMYNRIDTKVKYLK